MKLHSDFWLGEKIGQLADIKNISSNQLASYKRSISNFVRILTKKSIPVTFTTQGDSYTDGNRVTISSKINEKHFDSIVGLALHEASHIMLTDFDTLRSFNERLLKILEGGNYSSTNYEDYNREILQQLLNYVEDRRIDRYVYHNAPGYKEYYQSLYDRFFNDKLVDKALQSDEFRELNWDSYLFRIINFINENRDFDALPQLKLIYDTIFKNISKLSSTEDSFKLAVSIYDIIQKNVVNDNFSQNHSQNTNGGVQIVGELTESTDSNSPSNDSGMDIQVDDGNSTQDKSEGNSDKGNSSSEDNQSETKPERPELTDRQKVLIHKKIDKQRNFLKGDIKKTKISKTQYNEIESLSKADSKIVDIQYGDHRGSAQIMKTIVLRGLNSNTMNLMGYGDSHWRSDKISESINSGIKLGKKLGKKLQIRNYETQTELNRQKKGKIDKRRIYSIGADDFDIFKKVYVEKHTDAFLHLSVDLSSSMSGSKYNNAIQSAVAIIQMGEMTNIDVQLSLRVGSYYAGEEFPIMWIAYDSRKDKLSKIKKYLYNIYPKGVTPEGLCFDAAMDEFPIGNESLKTYFINFSDGAPWYKGYYGTLAVDHTKKQVDKLIMNGYNVLSFFITDNAYYESKDEFQKMYGQYGSYINPTELNKLTKQLQQMFEKR